MGSKAVLEGFIEFIKKTSIKPDFKRVISRLFSLYFFSFEFPMRNELEGLSTKLIDFPFFCLFVLFFSFIEKRSCSL